MPSQNQVEVTIFNAIGKRVRGLFLAGLSSGLYKFQWDGLDDHGRRLAAGVYFCRVTCFGCAKTLKLLFLP